MELPPLQDVDYLPFACLHLLSLVILSPLSLLIAKLISMESNYKEIEKDQDFQVELNNAGSKLVVADFFATWYDSGLLFSFQIPCHVLSTILFGHD